MKISIILLTLLSINNGFAQINDTVQSATYLAVKTITHSVDPNELIDMECGDWEKFGQEVSCLDEELYNEKQSLTDMDIMHDESVRVPHCDNSQDNNKKFCFTDQNFNSVLIKDDSGGANRLMMEFLCTNKRQDKDIKIAFGPCDEKSKNLKSDQMSCYCQYVNGEQKYGLAWHCTDFGKN